MLLICQNQGVLPTGGTANVLEGCLLESFAYIALSLLLGAIRINVVLVLTCTFLGYALGGLPFLANEMSAGAWVHAGQIGGYFMFAAGLFAYYGGTALLVNTAWHRALLPIGGRPDSTGPAPEMKDLRHPAKTRARARCRRRAADRLPRKLFLQFAGNFRGRFGIPGPLNG